MKSLVTTLLTIGTLMPTLSYALDFDALIEAAKGGNGTYVETHSSASTGGQTARSGETVSTGDVSASSHTEINAGNDGGTVKVKVETTENGKTTTKEFTKEIPKGEGVQVKASAEANDGESNTEVEVNGEPQEVTSEVTPPWEESPRTSVSLLFTEKIPGFVKKFFNLFAWF